MEVLSLEVLSLSYQQVPGIIVNTLSQLLSFTSPEKVAFCPDQQAGELEEITQLGKMNEATITLKVTVSSKSILPSELHNALFSLSGGLAAQIYDHLRDKMPELVASEDFETDWHIRINTCNMANFAKLEAARVA